MAKKKPAPWSINTAAAKDAAESAVKKTIPKKITPSKPKKKMGRPKATEGDTVKVLIPKYCRAKVRRMAAIDDISMIEVLEELINKEATKRGFK